MPRQYEDTHPWIDFTFNATMLSHHAWLLLGEAASKCQHVAGVPLRPEVSRELHTVYLVKGVHATTHIEGNTLTEEEVRQRVDGDLDLPPSREYLGVELDNVIGPLNEIMNDVQSGKPLDLTPDRLKHFNFEVLANLELREGVAPGEIRKHSVGVANYRGAPAEDCEYLLERLCAWLLEFSGEGDMRFPNAIFKAVLAHLYIAWIHPFGDGNGRTARLMEFQLLVESGVPMPAAHLLSDHYNRTRDRYYLRLDATSKKPTSQHVAEFVEYALQGFVDELRAQLETVRKHQFQVTWENYVHTTLTGDGHTARRQKHVLLDLDPNRWTARSELSTGVSVRLAREYAGKTGKTITRDINALLERNLIQRQGRHIRPNVAVVQAFLPVVREVLNE